MKDFQALRSLVESVLRMKLYVILGLSADPSQVS